jgi:hypothetical protein
MSGGDGGEGFLGRWSRLKRQGDPQEEGATEALQADETAAPAPPVRPVLPAQDLPELKLPELPSLDAITANTDMTVFMHPAVPEHVRGAALRKLWSVDPAIRDFVSPALDYAYDWNTPGGAPGYGPLGKGDDVLRMLGEIVNGYARTVVPEDEKSAPAADAPEVVAFEPHDASGLVDAGEEPAASDQPPVPETTTSAVLRADMPDEGPATNRRRHGGALPS